MRNTWNRRCQTLEVFDGSLVGIGYQKALLGICNLSKRLSCWALYCIPLHRSNNNKTYRNKTIKCTCTTPNFFLSDTLWKGDNLIEYQSRGKDTATFSHKRLLNNLKFHNNRFTYSCLVKLVQDNTPSSLDLCYNVLFVEGNFFFINFC